MYHYTESGLNNVWLVNGFTYHKTPYGKGASFHDLDGLHRLISDELVMRKPRLSGGEFRFVRKMLDMSQSGLASIIGKDAQSVARWEKQGRVPKMAERFLRAIYREHMDGNEKIIDWVKRLNEIDQHNNVKMLFEQEGCNWQRA